MKVLTEARHSLFPYIQQDAGIAAQVLSADTSQYEVTEVEEPHRSEFFVSLCRYQEEYSILL